MEISAGLVIGRRTAQAGNTEVRLLNVMITDERDVQTVQLIGQTGEENNPPDGSQVAVLALGESLKVAVASTDTVAPVMAPGGKRLYASAAGEVVAEIRLEPTGRVTITAAQIDLHAHVKTSGHVEVGTGANGVFTDSTGKIVTVQNGIIVGIV